MQPLNKYRAIIGHKVVSTDAKTGRLTLDDGKMVEVERNAEDYCTWFNLNGLHQCDNVIISVHTSNTEDLDGEGPYRAFLIALTAEGPVVSDAGSGYYLHGWSLAAKRIFDQDGVEIR
jgi:hypothetical protein